jgi:hypothetical protein
VIGIVLELLELKLLKLLGELFDINSILVLVFSI